MNQAEARKIMDVNVALAMIKCLTEQLAGMQWQHSYKVKQKFNKLLKVARQYEDEIDKAAEASSDESIEIIYEALMEHIVEGKEIALKQYNK